MASLNNIEQLRAFDWGIKYLWDVKWQPQSAPPVPFNDWFPAIDVEDNVANIESLTIEAHIHTFKVPRGTSVKELKITFYDDANNTLFKWLKDWMSGTDGIVKSGGKYVQSVFSISRSIHVIKLNRQRQEISRSWYRVYPDASLTFHGSSTSDAQTYTIPFVVVGSDMKF